MESTEAAESKPLFFYGHGKDTKYNFLSQWFLYDFEAPSLNGESNLTFNCCEQYIMYRKAMLFNDKAIANEIMAAKTPKKQKALGRKVREFDNEICIEHREQIVEDGNWYKFSTGQGKLAKKLLATGTTELIEASAQDRIWGIGFGIASAADSNRSLWGLNLLGKALVKVRTRLREQESKEEAGGAE